MNRFVYTSSIAGSIGYRVEIMDCAVIEILKKILMLELDDCSGFIKNLNYHLILIVLFVSFIY